MLQCVAALHLKMQIYSCVAVRCSVFQCVAAFCSKDAAFFNELTAASLLQNAATH